MDRKILHLGSQCTFVADLCQSHASKVVCYELKAPVWGQTETWQRWEDH